MNHDSDKRSYRSVAPHGRNIAAEANSAETVRMRRDQISLVGNSDAEITEQVVRNTKAHAADSSSDSQRTSDPKQTVAQKSGWVTISTEELDQCIALAPPGGWTRLEDVREHTSLSRELETSRQALRDLDEQRAAAVREHQRILQSAVDDHIVSELSRLAEERANVREQQQRAVAKQAIDIAEVILRRELRGAPDLGVLVNEAIDARGETPITVRVGDRAASETSAWDRVPVVWDPALELGDVVVEFVDGVLDFRVQTLLELAQAAIESSGEGGS